MKSYIYHSVKLSNCERLVTRYTVSEKLFLSILKFLFFLLFIWPLQIFIWWPIKILFKIILMVIEFILRGIWWIIKLIPCLLFMRKLPNY